MSAASTVRRVWCQAPVDTRTPGGEVVTVDLRTVEPAHLRELADLLEDEQWKRAAKLAARFDTPALGAYRSDWSLGLPEPPPGYQWRGCLLEAIA